MPRPLTTSEAARRLRVTRVTIRRRLEFLGITFEGAMTEAQYRRLKDSFAEAPVLPRGSLR
jgi:response regulator of citrate/malate metabolism